MPDKKTQDEIKKLLLGDIQNFANVWIYIDSEELGITGKMRVSDFIQLIIRGESA